MPREGRWRDYPGPAALCDALSPARGRWGPNERAPEGIESIVDWV